jgi:hypothetical protein
VWKGVDRWLWFDLRKLECKDRTLRIVSSDAEPLLYHRLHYHSDDIDDDKGILSTIKTITGMRVCRKTKRIVVSNM